MSEALFAAGQKYSRNDVFDRLGLTPRPSGGNWFTGYNSYRGAHFIFCNVGTGGRTGHAYGNEWEAPNRLRWFGKTSSRADQHQIRAMTGGGEPVYLFHRADNRDDFTFAGTVRAVKVEDTEPVTVLWEVTLPRSDYRLPEEVTSADTYVEGATRTVTVNAYERSGTARRKCVEHHGYACSVCGFDFGEVYGEIGENFIHVHHRIPLGSLKQSYEVDPIEDLRPVCPNCHAMLHTSDPPLEIAALQDILRSRGFPIP